jgi:flagellar biosynthetic protein FlhB
MANDRDQKTEKPTAKRKKENRKKGIVARSQTLVPWIAVLISTFVVPPMIGNVMTHLETGLRQFGDVAANPTLGQLGDSVLGAAWSASLAFLPMLALVSLVALVGSLAQVGFILTLGPITPKWEKISPKAGFKRLFSAKSLWETAKQVLLVTVILLVSVPAVMTTSQLLAGSSWQLSAALTEAGRAILSLAQVISAIGVASGVADFAWQRYSTGKDSMMTKQEIKEEFKQSDGDPQVKAKQRSIRMAMGRNQMLAAVADADVVITNPTHYAVALRYIPSKGAPKVVARGADRMAASIRERAKDAGVPMVAAPPLARALHAACRVDDEIPKELFGAVAAVLAFVHRIGRTRLAGAPVALPVVDTWTINGFDPDNHQRDLKQARRAARRRRPATNPQIG